MEKENWAWLNVEEYIMLRIHQTGLYEASKLGINFAVEWKVMAEMVDEGHPNRKICSVDEKGARVMWFNLAEFER